MAENTEKLSSAQDQLGTPQTVETEKPDVASIMADIRAEIKRDIGEHNDSVLSPFELFVSGQSGVDARAGEITHSEKLKTLNALHSFAVSRVQPEAISSHRPLIGKAIVWFKRKCLNALSNSILKEYFAGQHEFNVALVQHVNELSKSSDAVYWQLRKKIEQGLDRVDDENIASLRSAERRIFDSLNASLEDVKAHLHKSGADSAGHSARLDTLESVASGLERIIANISKPPPADSANRESGQDSAAQSQQTSAIPDYSYLLLENRYRGKEEQIAERLNIYPPIFSGCDKPVLEIGPGRGELQELFKSTGIPSYGIEIDEAMVERCRVKNLDVRLEDGMSHLAGLPDKSIGGVIATQVIEHLSQAQLTDLLSLCSAKVVDGGKVAFETINSESIIALTQHYFRDPTHVWPLHPETMSFMVELAGLKVIDVLKLSPFPEESLLRELQVEDYMTPRWAQTINLLNENTRRLNQLLYGFQDYCIIAQVGRG